MTVENLGIFQDPATPMTTQPIANPSAYFGISAEGHSDATNNPVDNIAYWQEQVLRGQRWSRTKNLGTRDSGQGKKSVKAYYSMKNWTNNRTEKNQNFGEITYTGTGPGVGSPQAPPKKMKWGYVVGFDSAPNAGYTGYFDVDFTVQIYVKYWNKRPNYSLGP